ncbi:SHOCT domain-containing protein [Clostridium sp.]|uniref:SHOCT domain-containing protein n=1 Tax=Clostridium sp. TaxID=1506 RepID=UPI002624FE4D|nr:SHOCT domain-containing protein [Clostridium sp.]
MMGYGYSMMGGWSGMMIIPIILTAAVMYLIFNQEESNKLKVCKVGDNSLNILNERFARGEISEDEYNRIKSTLRS